MGFFSRIKDVLAGTFHTISSEAASVLRSLKNARSPLADRLLADALRLAEIPSPTVAEERRAAFVMERLSSLGLSGSVDEEGNVLVRLSCADGESADPLLLFADLGTDRWRPLESLSRLDSDTAHGAGLADALGVAALLSIAESVLSGHVRCRRDLLLLFAARSPADPRSGIFKRLTEDVRLRPFAALGVRGFTLGRLALRSLGTYRLEVSLRTDADGRDSGDGPAQAKGGGAQQTQSAAAVQTPPSAVDAAVLLARKLSGVVWDAERTTICRIRRIEAGSGFGKDPVEGILDIELESSNGAVLDMAMKAATATAEETGKEAKAKTEVRVVGYVPVGDPAVSAGLLKSLQAALRDQHVRIREYSGSDTAAYLTALGVPAVSLGLARGREGLAGDEVDVESIETGRKVLALLVERPSEGAFA